jgi:hypothetical protein
VYQHVSLDFQKQLLTLSQLCLLPLQQFLHCVSNCNLDKLKFARQQVRFFDRVLKRFEGLADDFEALFALTIQ